MKIILLISVICYAAFATQYVPIPKREHGILIGNPAAEVKIDLIYDPVCDGSAYFDQTLQKAWGMIDPEIKEKVSLRFISLSLPYHIASQKLTQAIIYVQQQKGNQEALTLFRDFLSDTDKNDEDNIRNETIRGLMRRIAQRVNTLFGLETEDVLKELAHYSVTDNKVRQWSKFVMGAIKAAGTPRLRVNGVIVESAVDMSP